MSMATLDEQRREGTALHERLDLVRRRLFAVEPLADARTCGSRSTSPTVLRNIPGRASTQRTAMSMSAGSVSGSYHVDAVCGRPSQRRERDALDRLHRDAALGARLRERLEVLRVERIPQLANVVRQQHRVEREPLEAAAVHRGDRETVTGDADESHETLVARLDRRLERAAVAAAPSPTRSRRRGCAAGSGRRGRRRADRASGGCSPSRPCSRGRPSSSRRRSGRARAAATTRRAARSRRTRPRCRCG